MDCQIITENANFVRLKKDAAPSDTKKIPTQKISKTISIG
jgi:hypothetical protein